MLQEYESWDFNFVWRPCVYIVQNLPTTCGAFPLMSSHMYGPRLCY
jgi:hypothetical protein